MWSDVNDYLEKLKADRDKIDKQIKMEEDRISAEKMSAVVKKIEALTAEEKENILSHMRHSCTSCSDEYPCNGYSAYSGTYRCSKCMMMEILNGEHGGMFDFELDVSIIEV